MKECSININFSVSLAMNFLKKSDPKAEMRANQRNLRTANRELESDRRLLERRERELEAEIKKLAKQGHKDACAQLAKQLIQLRKQKTKSLGMSAKMSEIGAQNTNMYSLNRMANTMGSTVNTMKLMNKQMPAEDILKNLKEFQEQSERMGLTEEMMSDSLDAILDDPSDEAEQEAIVNKVLDEIGIETNSKLATIPGVPNTVGKLSVTDSDIEKMLAQLRA